MKMKVSNIVPKQTKGKSLRSQLSQCTAKICSYMECGRQDEARQWASILQKKLIELNLLVDTHARPGYDGPQPENATTVRGQAK